MNWYGFLFLAGVLSGSLVIEKIKNFPLFKQKTKDEEIFELVFWVVLAGLIGARLYHLCHKWHYYQKNLKEIFYLWQGGLGIFGGIIGGILGLYFYFFWQELKRKKFLFKKVNFKIIKKNFLIWLDLAAVGLPLGQVVGRWGNYFNQEIYGLPTSLPWGIYIKPEKRIFGYEGFDRFHPLFFYESLWCFLIFLILFKKTRIKINFEGELALLYLLFYSFGRFWLEFLRPEGWEWRGIRVNQLVAGFLFLGAVFLWQVKKSSLHLKASCYNKKDA